MIVREFYIQRKDGVNLYRTYSSDGYKIQKVGTEEIYDDAIDVETADYEYVETDQKIQETLDEVAEEIIEEIVENTEDIAEEV